MRILDILLAIPLTAGVALSLTIWWWLFVAPIVRGCRQLAGRRRPSSLNHKEPPSDSEVSDTETERESRTVLVLSAG
jgi:hypothetical protein